jgi:Phosphoribosyl transferase domain
MPRLTFSSPMFSRDSRGNRLVRWSPVDEGSSHLVWLCGPHEVVDQLRAIAPDYVQLPVPADAGSGWTQVLRAPGSSPRPEVRQILDLLSTVISLPSPPGVAVAIALDWYKIPNDEVDPREWSNTEIGELISREKYRYRSDAIRQADAGIAVANRICELIASHAGLRQATTVTDIPGHDSTRVSFGSRLAATIARDRRLRLVRTSARSTFRPESKNMDEEQRGALIKDQFVVNSDLRGQSVLIIDDVFKTGTSMGETARAVRAAGATTVQGVCAVRTMRAR